MPPHPRLRLREDDAPPVLLGRRGRRGRRGADDAAAVRARDVAPVVSLGVVYLLVVLLVATSGAVARGRRRRSPARSRSTSSTSRRPAASRSRPARTGSRWSSSSSPRSRELAGRDRAPRAPSRPTSAARRPTCRPRWRGCCCAAGGSRRRCRRSAQRLAQALGLPAPRSSCAPSRPASAASSSRCARARARSALLVPARGRGGRCARVQMRIVPALEALLAAALERDALPAEVVETAALRRSDVIKTALLRAVSHDLRSPLTAILAAAEALARRRSPRTSARSWPARRRSRRAALAPGRQAARPLAAGGRRRRAAAGVVLDRGGRRRRGRGPRAARRARSRLASTATCRLVRADAAQLERAFANLLENAHRHRGGHPVSVRARAVGGAHPGPRRRPRAGHPAGRAERIFEPFYRAGTERTGHRGSGLGLAIVRGFVEANGGKRLGRVAARPGHDLRGRAAARAAERPSAGGERERGPASWSRRRAADPARPQGRSCARPASRRSGENGAGGARAPRCTGPTRHRRPRPARRQRGRSLPPSGARGGRCRSSCSCAGGEEARRSALSSRAPTTTYQAVRSARARRAATGRAAAADPAPREPGRRLDGPGVDLASHHVSRDGDAIHLTPIEFNCWPGWSQPRAVADPPGVLAEVWGPDYADDGRPCARTVQPAPQDRSRGAPIG